MLPFPLQLRLKPVLDLLPLNFKQFLVARHVENQQAIIPLVLNDGQAARVSSALAGVGSAVLLFVELHCGR